MISEKIIELRKSRGWSQEQLAEQLGISRQSVSKWESDMAVPDLDRIIKMSDLFGVSVDYLVKEEVNDGAGSGHLYSGNYSTQSNEQYYADGVNTQSNGQYYADGVNTQSNEQYYADECAAAGRAVSMQEAERYMKLVEQTSKKIALGVTLCILSPVLLILLFGLADNSLWDVSEGLAAGMGVTVLLCIVTVAVALFIINGLKLEKYEYLEKEKIVLDEKTRLIVEKSKTEYEPKYQRGIVVGVIICIVSAIPLVGISCLLPVSDTNADSINGLIVLICVDLLLIIVSVGVNMLVRVSSIWGSYQKLLQEGDYTTTMKEGNNKIEAWAGIYWSIVTAVYLGISFIGKSGWGWGRSWIIWPVAGVAFGAICGIIKIVSAGKK